MKEYVTDEIFRRATNQYEHIRMLEPNINPARKVGLLVAGREGQLFIEQLPDPEGEDASDDAQYNGAGGILTMNEKHWYQSAEMQAVFRKLASIRRQNDCLQTEIELTKTNLLKKMKLKSDTLN